MKNPITGVGFLTPHQSLPSYTFTSADAVNWLINHVEHVTNVDEAMQILQSMHEEQLICHASGTFSEKLFYGFYLYHIVDNDKGDIIICLNA